jgi:outer membrane protein assembly factor BamB
MLDYVWRYQTHHWPGVFLVDANQCFITARKTRLICLDLSSGTEVWSVTVKNPWGWLAVTPSRVFYLNQHSLLVAHSRKDGQILWSRTLRGINGLLHANEDAVIVGGWRGYTDILCLDPDSGEERWRCAASRKQIHSTRIYRESHTLLVAESEAEAQRLLGSITHNRQDFLPFAMLSNNVYAFGTSIGLIYIFGTSGSLLAKQKIGKSICSCLVQHTGGLVFASGSGEILSMSLPINEWYPTWNHE